MVVHGYGALFCQPAALVKQVFKCWAFINHKGGTMDKVIDKLAGMGVAGLVLAIVISISGYAGAAALTSSLALLGGPWGMIGGIGVLLLIGSVSTAIANYGIDAVAKGIVQKMIDDGKSKSDIKSEIDSFPIISKDMKVKLNYYVDQA